MPKKKTHEEFIKELQEKHPENFNNIEILGEYKGIETKISCKCKICGYGENGDWNPTPHSLLKGSGCRKCFATRITKTNEDFIKELHEINPNIEPLEEYKGALTGISCKCKICGYGENGEWKPQPSNLLGGMGCQNCHIIKQTKTHEDFIEELHEVNPNIEVLGEYKNIDTGISCKCKICGYGENGDWKPIPYNILKGSGCPGCIAKTKTSWLQEELTKHFSQNYTVLSRDTSLIGMELDIVIPELNIAIEPGSWYWHFETQNRLSNDYTKQQLCKEKGYTCITIYDNCDFPDVIWYPALVYDKDIGRNRELLSQVIQDIEETIKEVQQSANYN